MITNFNKFKHSLNETKTAINENYALNFNDIIGDITIVNNLFENEYITGNLDIEEGYTIDEIMLYLANEFGIDKDYFDLNTTLAKVKNAIIAYDTQGNTNESVRHGVFPWFIINIKTYEIKYGEVSNDLAQEAVLENNDDSNVIAFCTSWSRSQCENVANDIITRLKNGESKQTILDDLFDEWY